MDVVTVACKLRNGMILRTHRKIKQTVPVIGGGSRDQEIFQPTGERFYIHGNTAPHAEPLLDADGNAIMLEQSFALTPNVPKAFWDLWLEQHADSAIVKNGLIFASSKPLELRSEAKAHRDQRHGLEPLDPQGDPRVMSRRQKLKAGAISELSKADVASTG